MLEIIHKVGLNRTIEVFIILFALIVAPFMCFHFHYPKLIAGVDYVHILFYCIAVGLPPLFALYFVIELCNLLLLENKMHS